MSFLPQPDRDYLTSKSIEFEEVEEGGKKAVILRGRALPVGKFDAEVADILILLPRGYPDVAPDMFYLLPWIKIIPAGKYPNKADQPLNFAGQKWQRWSRHNKEWRPGVDGIWTMLKRVEHALENAA